MTFQQLRIGDYFRLSGMNNGYVYRKASDSLCSLNGILQPMRAYTPVRRVTKYEVYEYFAIVQAEREQLNKRA